MKFQGSIDFTVIENESDRVVLVMPIKSGIKNPFGVVQAGAMLWLADVTSSILVLGGVMPSEDMKGFPLAISLNANFLANQREGSFRAVASFVKKGRNISVVRTVGYGESDRIIADVTTSHVLST
jgi:1,4-dihydroxy-2-naphthoyl-CoA hydrolase